MKHSTWKPLLALSLMSILGACAAPQSEKDLLLEAQFCLDTAASSEVAGCLSKISHIRNSAASALRCAGGFISQELTSPENLGGAINALMDDNSGSLTLLGALKMDSDDVAAATAAECNASGSSSYMLLGAMARSSTKLGTVLGNNASVDCTGKTALECSVASIEEGINELVGSGSTLQPEEISAAIEAIGSTVSVVYDTTCGSAKANEDICGMIDEALQGVDISNTQAVGDKLLEYWQQYITSP